MKPYLIDILLQAEETCTKRGFYPDYFNCTMLDCVPQEQVSGDLYTGGIWLGCLYGTYCFYVWAVGIFASGQASTMTGTYAGQFAMQGFLNLDWKQWKILVVTRLVAMSPTLIVAVFTNIQAKYNASKNFTI